MAKTTIGILNVKLNAQTAAFGKDLRKSRKGVKRFSAGLVVGLAAVTALGLGAVRAGKQLTSLARETAQYGDDLLNASQKIGIATDELQALRFAGRVTSVEMSKLDGGLLKLTRAVGEGIDGNREYKDTFDKLGLSVEAMGDMTADQQLRAFADALQGVDTNAEKVAAAAALMGKSGAELLPMLANGSAGLDEFEKKFRSTGAAIDTEGAAKLAAANAELEFFSTMVKGAARNVGGALAPSIGALGKTFRELASEIAPNDALMVKMRKSATDMFLVALGGIGKAVQGFAWLGAKTNRIFAGMLDAAADLFIALQRLNPASDMKKVRAIASVQQDIADGMRERAEMLERVNKALGESSLADRFLKTLSETSREAREYAESLAEAADLQREIGKIADDQQRNAGPGQFEQVVRSQVSLGGVRGSNYAAQTVGRLDTLIALTRKPQAARVA